MGQRLEIAPVRAICSNDLTRSMRWVGLAREWFVTHWRKEAAA
jgi:hypothetical protein